MSEVKHFTIEDCEQITIDGLRLYKTSAPGMRTRLVHMKFQDCSAKMMVGDEIVGSVCGCIAGQVEVEVGDTTYTIQPLDLFELVESAVNVQNATPTARQEDEGNGSK